MTTNDGPPQLVLQQVIQGFQVTQCIYVAAKLNIADLLKDGPRTSEELAQATGAHAPALYRVLRLLTAIDLLTEQEEHSFALTPLGAYLQRGVTGSMHDTVLCYAEKPTWSIWGALLYSVQTGEPSPEHVLGLKTWDYYSQHPEEAVLFHHMMTEWTASVAPTVATAYDFSATQTLVDVGGGHGSMLAPILQTHPTLQGVIHDWDDERAIVLLSRCHQAMQPRGKVLLVERVILTGSTPQVLVLESDVQMLVWSGGKERTDAQYHTLLGAAGFELTRLIPVLPPFYVVEAVRR